MRGIRIVRTARSPVPPRAELARIVRERAPTLTPALSLSEGDGVSSIPSPEGGEGEGEGVPRTGMRSTRVRFVVRAIGSDLHMEYTAVGQTTHLAARMEQMATTLYREMDMRFRQERAEAEMSALA